MNELLLRRRSAIINSTPSLPYDAEVEYLKSSGTQYINTGIKPNKDTRVKIRYSFIKPTILLPFGVRDSGNATNAKNGIFRTHGDYNRVAFGNGNGTNSNIFGYNVATTIYEVFFDKNNIYIDGDFIKTITTSNWSSNFDFFLFGINDSGTFQSTYSGTITIYSCKIWNDATLVRDYVPVRVGQVGYMYDKVSGNLFGNNGTGSFTIGNDIT